MRKKRSILLCVPIILWTYSSCIRKVIHRKNVLKILSISNDLLSCYYSILQVSISNKWVSSQSHRQENKNNHLRVMSSSHRHKWNQIVVNDRMKICITVSGLWECSVAFECSRLEFKCYHHLENWSVLFTSWVCVRNNKVMRFQGDVLKRRIEQNIMPAPLKWWNNQDY